MLFELLNIFNLGQSGVPNIFLRTLAALWQGPKLIEIYTAAKIR